MRPMVQTAISFCCTADPDPDDPKKLAQHKDLVGFELSNKTFEAMWQMLWVKLDPHELMYEIEYKIAPSRASKLHLPKAQMWGDYVQNAEICSVYDKWLHAAFGYDNSVFTAFLKPWQKVLAKVRTRTRDDTLDIHEKGTIIVQGGLWEACKLFKTTLKSPSPDEQLPNGGNSLLQPTSSYYSGIQKLSDSLDSQDEGSDVFEHKAQKERSGRYH